MTREEAIKIIDCYDIGFYDLSGEKIPADKLAEALDMAIEALSETSGDLISRQDAISSVEAELRCTNKGEDVSGLTLALSLIDALPSALADIGDYADRLWKIAYERGKAEAEAEHDHEPGQWQTEDGRKTKAEYSVYCSKCGSWSEYRTKYCGNCGSLMKEENDEQ